MRSGCLGHGSEQPCEAVIDLYTETAFTVCRRWSIGAHYVLVDEGDTSILHQQEHTHALNNGRGVQLRRRISGKTHTLLPCDITVNLSDTDLDSANRHCEDFPEGGRVPVVECLEVRAKVLWQPKPGRRFRTPLRRSNSKWPYFAEHQEGFQRHGSSIVLCSVLRMPMLLTVWKARLLWNITNPESTIGPSCGDDSRPAAPIVLTSSARDVPCFLSIDCQPLTLYSHTRHFPEH